jgi:hypothetical protein
MTLSDDGGRFCRQSVRRKSGFWKQRYCRFQPSNLSAASHSTTCDQDSTSFSHQENKKRKHMSKNNSVVAIYPSHTAAEAAVKELQQSGFDMKKLSIVGRDYHTDEHVVGYYNNGDRMKRWGKIRSILGLDLGMFVRFRVFPNPRHRAGANRRTVRRMACRGVGKCGRSWWAQRTWGRIVWFGNPQRIAF